MSSLEVLCNAGEKVVSVSLMCLESELGCLNLLQFGGRTNFSCVDPSSKT